ncbi:phosphate-binding protein PstS [Cellulomonas cellasea]|uniref:Phosphate-binding protein n=1 Tax=Cellulomonas cellasea TaxID=43670 RepID=A0A4Y3KZ16_9CELL|nr:phosphate-binding protein PstS [Cellulomonas cellasea]
MVRQRARNVGLVGVALVLGLALGGCGSQATPGSGASAVPSTSATEAAAAAAECGSGTIDAAGSSAQRNAVEQAIITFATVCPDVVVRYDASGSGAGITRFTAGEVAFAGSDSALNAGKGEVDAAAARCGGAPAWNLPMVTGPVALAYNLDTVGQLVLDAATTARIFRGEIVSWDDPAIAALNPGELLPAEEIQVLFRADESGTTENFTRYLATAAADVWTDAPAKTWPVEGVGEGREKSAGVAEAVATTPSSLTYVEWSYAKENRLGVAKIDNGSGPVELTAESVGATVATAERTGAGDDLTLRLDHATREPGAYPIVLVTYEVVCSTGLDEPTAAAVRAFLRHLASTEVQQSLADIGYAPLPTSVREDVLDAIGSLG